MKIVLMPWRFSDYYGGGMEMSVYHLARKLTAKGNKVVIVAAKVEKHDKTFEVLDGIEIYRHPFPTLYFMGKGDLPLNRGYYLTEAVRFFSMIFAIFSILVRKKPKIINIHYVGPQSVAILLLSYLTRFKLVLTLQGFGTQVLNSSGVFKWSKLVFKKVLRRAGFITALSQNLLENATHWVPDVKGKIKVIPHGVDKDEFNSGHKFISNIDIDKKEMVKSKHYIYSNYKYWPNKHYSLLLFAYRSILDLGYDIDLVLSMDNDSIHIDDGIFELLGLRQRVKIIDSQSRIDRETLLKDSSLYICLSKGQFCDHVALEALSLGKPIIADLRNDIYKMKNDYDKLTLIDIDKESEIISEIERLIKEQDTKTQTGRHWNTQSSLIEKGLTVSPYLLTVCNIYRYKGINTLIKAFKLVSEAFPEFNLVIAGEGDQRDFLQRFSKRIGLKDRVIFVGSATRQEVVRLFKGCEFFVLPSWIEPFGIVNLEAMAAGKAIVATGVDGIAEIVEDNVNGILVEPKNHKALAEAMMRLLGDKELRERLGKNGRKTVEGERFSWDRIADEYVTVYEDDSRF